MSDVDFDVDGAHEGVLPIKAMREMTGSEPLADGDRHSIPEMEKLIRATPLPDSGVNLFDPGEEATEDDYDAAALSLAHCYLILLDEGHTLEYDGVYTEDEVIDFIKESHPEWLEPDYVVGSAEHPEGGPNWRDMIGVPKGTDHELFRSACDKWKGLNEHCGGLSGFQAGWAYNMVRAIHNADPVDNPAFMQIEVENPEGEGEWQ